MNKDALQITHSERLASLETKVDLVLSNHLPHIYEEVKEIRKDISSLNWKMAIFTGAVGVIVFVIDKIF